MTWPVMNLTDEIMVEHVTDACRRACMPEIDIYVIQQIYEDAEDQLQQLLDALDAWVELRTNPKGKL